VLYEWITGFKLFTGDSEVAVLKSITEGKIYAPSYFKADIPEQVESILMRALEKDRERRYQTAWDMQYDIDQFLSQYEFTPSNIHLSNFLKQLFNDELEEEKARLAAVPGENKVPQEQDDDSAEDIISNIEPIPLRPDRSDDPTTHGRGQSQPRLVNVALTNQQVDALQAIADENHVKLNDLLREIVSSWLKYR
jgi:serine/threonine-protein kinase